MIHKNLHIRKSDKQFHKIRIDTTMSDNEKISDEKKEGREKIEKKRGWQSLRGTDNDSGEQPHVSVRPTSSIVTPPNVPTMIEA
jgi:hypothetical protein